MFSRLTQGVTSVLQELSGEERHDDDPQGDLVPRALPAADESMEDSGASDETLERLAQTEQLVVQLKELIREKDAQLAHAERQLKEEKDQGEAKFTKLKLQAKARMAALNKQITELKGQEELNSSQNSESSFTIPAGLEEELQQVKQKLIQEESLTQNLQRQLQSLEQQLQQKEEDHTEQVRVLQAVVKDKDVRFQEQILHHEEELLQLTTQISSDAQLQQALRESQRRIEELEESLRSRAEVLEMMQQELNNADQQKQILTTQFRQMEQELSASRKLKDNERHTEEQVQFLRANLEEREQMVVHLQTQLTHSTSELDEVRRKLEMHDEKEKEMETDVGDELSRLRASLNDSERTREELRKKMEEEVERHVSELHHALENEKSDVTKMLETQKLEAMKKLEEEEERHTAEENRLQEKLSALETEKLEVMKKLEEEAERRASEIQSLQEKFSIVELENEEVKRKLQEVELEREEVRKTLEEEVDRKKEEVEEVMKSCEAELQSLQQKFKTVEEEKEEARKKMEEGELEREAARNKLTEVELQNEEVKKKLEMEVEMLQEKLNKVEREKEEELKAIGEVMQSRMMEEEQREAELQGEQEAMGGVRRVRREIGTEHSFLIGPADGGGEDTSLPDDPAQVLLLLKDTVETLRAGQQEREVQISQNSLIIEDLRAKLDRSFAEGEEAAAKVRELEQQLKELQVTDESLVHQGTDRSQRDLDGADRGPDGNTSANADHAERVSVLELQLVEQERELSALREKLAFAEQQNIQMKGNAEYQITKNILNVLESPEVLLSFEDTSAEDTTLIAEDVSAMSTSVLSIESCPEITGTQPESPVELKGTSSDEMATSTDSEVARSSWTLLEAANQEAGHEWPPQIQHFGALHLSTQSWEESGEERVTSSCSMVEVESSSVLIRETVQVHIGQQEIDLGSDSSSGQAFAQILAQEIQKRYSALLSELQQLKDAASESQEKNHLLENDLKSLTVIKDEAETRAQSYERDLMDVRAELQRDSEQQAEEITRLNNLKKVLEQQLESFQMETSSSNQKIQDLQSDLDELQHTVSEKEGLARMLTAELQNREIAFSELSEKLISMEERVQCVTKEAELAKSALLEKATELEKLQKCISLKEQEIIENNESMLHEGEEKFALSNEVEKLRNQISEMKKNWDEEQMEKPDKAVFENDELLALRKENENLSTQIANMKMDGEQIKRKLQAALVQRKELMKKIRGFEKESTKEHVEMDVPSHSADKSDKKIQKLEALLTETRDLLNSKEEVVNSLEQKILSQGQELSEAHSKIQSLSEESKSTKEHEQMVLQFKEDNTKLQSQVTTLESELEAMQKKLQEAVDARKDTLRKAKEKDRHHREQLKQQKEEHSDLLERCKTEDSEKAKILNRLEELEHLLVSKEHGDKERAVNVQETSENVEKEGWVQEDWVDFSAPDVEAKEPDANEQSLQAMSEGHERLISSLQAELKAERVARKEVEESLQESQRSLALKDSDLLELNKEMEVLKVKERQIDGLSKEMDSLREKCQQAEAHADILKSEMAEAAAAARARISDSESPVVALQAEVEEFKQFLKRKNDEIIELSQQLNEQGELLQKMQETVLMKDQMIASLEKGLKAEQEKIHRLEAEIPLRQEEEKDDHNVKLQQLQRKLQAALLSRKEVLKENQSLKEETSTFEKIRLELLAKIEAIEREVSKLRMEKEKLIQEVDKALLENQGLGATCESLKLAMDGLLNEKNAFQRQSETIQEETERERRKWEDKLQGMKEEYETLLKSYENVSDEAERVRKVLEAARQDRQEAAAKARAQEVAKQEAERLAEEAQKEVDTVKEKMRKFAKAKQHKIMELEEENERLREQVEKVEKIAHKEVGKELNLELLNVRSELKDLKANFKTVEAQRSSLELETEQLRQQLAQEMNKNNSEDKDFPVPAQVIEEKMVFEQMSPVSTEHQEDQANQSKESVVDQIEKSKKVEEGLRQQMAAAEANLNNLRATLDAEKSTRLEQELRLNAELALLKQQLQESIHKETMLKIECSKQEHQLQELRTSFEDPRGTKGDQMVLSDLELQSFQQKLLEAKEREDRKTAEFSKREAQLLEICRGLEVEKDDLEERLMNQLAQVNGSIAGYQQEAADCRDRLVDLQRELEKMERESADLEAMLASERDRTARLEEEKRQAQRERAEAEAEAGKQRELEQKLKSAQRVKEGSQSRARQLEELLREKQLEVRQMQKDCIQYQERISDLDRQVKALSLSRDEVSSELQLAHQEIARITETRTRLESELSVFIEKVNVAQAEAKQAIAEKRDSEQLAQRREAELKAEAERTLDEVRYRLGAELKQMELRLEQAYHDREREEEATLEARSIATAAEKYAQEIQARLDESLARLAAFSRSMCSLQDDRDRVLDEAKQWESRFHSALQGKEAELRETETKAKDLAEQLQTEMTQKEKLQSALERSEKTLEQQQQEWTEAEMKHKQAFTNLENENEDLQQKLSQAENSLVQMRSQLALLEAEAEGLRHRVKALDEAVDKLQGEANQAKAEIKDREAEGRKLCLNLEQTETDLRSAKTLMNTLQLELAEKEKREMELLGEKEQAVAQAVEEARKEADSRAEEAEKQLEERKSTMRNLKEKLSKAEEDASQSKARLDSFTKAMGSLQDDRDRVLSLYKRLEERHLQLMMEKDSLIQEAATENNGLKEELRALLSQRDDLHAENAKLDAQLHGYRDELNQVLAMKDSQHKKLLSAQLEHISALEKDREVFQTRIAAMEQEASVRQGVRVEHETLSQLGQTMDAPGAEVEKLREQLQAAQKQISTLEETLAAEKESFEAHNKELKALRWEGGILRTETETAEERVVELARDLMEMEQKFLVQKESVAQLTAQNQSFGQAMASLQDSRDEAVNEVKELCLQLEEIRQMGASAPPPSSSSSTGEVWSLKNALSALQNDRDRMLEQLQLQRSELNRLGSGELAILSTTLEEERRMTGEMKMLLSERDGQLEKKKQELETLRLERSDLHSQAESLKQQTLATLSDRDAQIRQLSAMLEEVRASEPKLLQEHAHRQGGIAEDSAPGGPLGHSENYKAECVLLQRRLDEEAELRLSVEEQLASAKDHLNRYTQEEWHPGLRDPETAVLIEPREGAVIRSRPGGRGLMRVLRGALCPRQRTPLLVSVYLLTIHALLLLCLGGYL